MTDNASREQRDQQLFDRIAGQYCAKDLYPACVRARRLRLTQTLAAVRLPAEPRMLEVGCGAGFSAAYLAGRFSSYTGIDYSAELIRHAESRHHVAGASFITADLHTFNPPQPYDVIFLIGVLHHMPERLAATQRMVSMLKPGGYLAANEPQAANPLIGLLRRLRARMDGNYSEEQEELRASELRKLFQDAGLVDVQVRPQGILSTPFAEVKLPPAWLALVASSCACATDRLLEAMIRPLLRPLAWNLIVTGRRPS